MIELIVLGLLLFIVGVGATIAYDKHKERMASRPVRTTPTPKSTSVSGARQQRAMDKLISSIDKTYEAQKKAVKVSTPKATKKYKKLSSTEIETSFEKAFLEAMEESPESEDTTISAQELIKQIQKLRDRK